MPEILPDQSDQNFLYQLICSQLENDGFLKSAKCLQVELNSMPNKFTQGDKLEKLVNMCIQIKQHIDFHIERKVEEATESSMDADSTNQGLGKLSLTSPLTNSFLDIKTSPLKTEFVASTSESLTTGTIETTNATSSSEVVPPKLEDTLEKEQLLKQQLYHQQLILQQIQLQQQQKDQLTLCRDDQTKRLSDYMMNCYKSDYSMLRDTLSRDQPIASMLHDNLTHDQPISTMLRDSALLSPFLARPGNILNLPPTLPSLDFSVARSSPIHYTTRSAPGSYSLNNNKGSISPLNMPIRSSSSTPTTPTFKHYSPLNLPLEDKISPKKDFTAHISTDSSPAKSPATDSTDQPVVGIKVEDDNSKAVISTAKTKPNNNGTDIDRKRFPCRFCGRRFTQQSALQVHERTHTGEKPYHCHYCDKAFTQISNLKCHERLHTGEKPYRCQLCGKRFTQSASLRCHMRSHTGERPYLCKYCQKRFTQPASLQHHIRIHTGEKPYKCEHCGKSFTQPSSLVVHRRLHTGERPFVCQICGKSYTQAMPLKEHMRTHHLITPVQKNNLNFNMSSPFSLQVNHLQNSMANLPLFLSSKLLPNFPHPTLPLPASTSTTMPQMLFNHQNTAFQSVGPKPDIAATETPPTTIDVMNDAPVEQMSTS